MDKRDRGGRLIRVLLPDHLVERLDQVVGAGHVYADRNSLVADAIDGHLLELESLEGSGPVMASDLSGWKISAPSPDTPTLPRCGEPSTPTWGMHNRDFPTLWALWRLTGDVATAGAPVPFVPWLESVVRDSWNARVELASREYDIAGFPSNVGKAQASEGRFRRFFVGDEVATGPIFSLGLAGGAGALVAPTSEGLSLLAELDGLTCSALAPAERATFAFFEHLRSLGHPDYRLFRSVLEWIGEGVATRDRLLSRLAVDYPQWSRAQLQTNLAGMVGRTREWGLVERKQAKGKYEATARAVRLVE